MIKKAAVLGSGIMGSGIAALLAGAGVPTLLLDILPPDAGSDRNRLAKSALQNLTKTKPSPLYSQKDLQLITPGNFDDDWKKLADCDWIIEAVVEKLEIKRQVFEKLERTIRSGAVVSSNTSGLSLKAMAEGRSSAFRKNFLITHFFNPVRYMRLVEIVSSPETDPETVRRIRSVLEGQLGKGVVIAKDTPNFIANRIGIFGWFSALKAVVEEGYKVGEADKILGEAIGRPKSGMFRTADMVGLDTLLHVAQNSYEGCADDEARSVHKPPTFLQQMVERQWLGEKTGQGFYKKVKGPEGSEILALDLATLEYRPQQKVRFDSLGAVKEMETAADRIRFMVQQPDRAGQLAWKTVRDVLIYSANRVPEIADDVRSVDDAMKWGFNWDLGPFETWDALGVRETVARIEKEGVAIPPLVQKVLKGEGRFYPSKKQSRYGTEIRKNDSASLYDLGDGIGCLEFHSKMNAIDDEIIQAIHWGVEDKNLRGLVLYNEGANFSVGANLMLLFMAAQSGEWKQIEKVIKDFQEACLLLRYSKKPTIAAPFNLALGGGCEVSLGADAIVAHVELYMGLVEVGVGLIPAGGGCKEMIRRFDATVTGGPFPKVQRAFETIAFAKVSTSAKEAMELGYLSPTDTILFSRDHLLSGAKENALERAKNYQPSEPRTDLLLPGKGGYYALVSAIEGYRWQGIISEHDELIAKKLAHILTGGEMPNPGLVSEAKLLDLEREAFLSLIGTEKTQERIQHMLMKGKPLRN